MHRLFLSGAVLLLVLWGLLTGVWSANGCEVDPNGRCLPGPAAASADNGCEVDPSGRCRS